MSCLLCASGNQAEFGGEILIHFRDLENLDKPSVWVFPKLFVCLDCGSSRFMTQKANSLFSQEVLRRVNAQSRPCRITA